MDNFSQALTRSPELFPVAQDSASNVALLRLTEADYAAASFLDGRILTPHRMTRTLPYSQIEAAVAESGIAERCHFIFHTGHVGSTLLSRLLGAHPALFSLREPQILRDLSQAPDDGRLTTFLKLWSRTFRPEQTALIKATSFVSELAPALMARPSAPRALLMYVQPEPFLATILAGENAPTEAKALLPARLKRLQTRLGGTWVAANLSPGEAIAAGWACEMTALSAASETSGARALWFDFERYLAAPHEMLSQAFAHFGVAASETEVSAILAGPDSQRYSKAPEHAYDATLRARVLDAARSDHAGEIARGLAWLQGIAAKYPAIDTPLRN